MSLADNGVDVSDSLPEGPANGWEYLWEIFFELSRTRQSGMGGASAISYQEIAAYSKHMGWDFARFEVEILMELDQLFLKVNSDLEEESRRKNTPHGKANPSSRGFA